MCDGFKKVNLYKYLFSAEIAFDACPASVRCVSLHDPPEVNTTPRYENLETISISAPSYVNIKPFGNLPPFLKITTFVLVMFTLSFHF